MRKLLMVFGTGYGGFDLAEIFFQLLDDYVEISWDNRFLESGVEFLTESGGERIPKDIFYAVVDSFPKEYARHWFG